MHEDPNLADFPPHIRERRERFFIVLCGLFLGTLTMLNILGVTRFINLSFHIGEVKIPFILAVGVLPYPITFLCTDFISEFYGRRRANLVVWVGVLLNIWVIAILWLGGVLPPVPEMIPGVGMPEVPTIDLENNTVYDPGSWAFYRIRFLTFGAVVASMLAYMVAQFCDVFLFHFWKNLTKGKHLWLRNNGSTLISQFVDTFAVISITHFYADGLAHIIDRSSSIWPQLWKLIAAGYVFKLAAALFDTIPFYIGVKTLGPWLGYSSTKAEV